MWQTWTDWGQGQQLFKSNSLSGGLGGMGGPKGLKGQVWTRHEAPAAPASQALLPTQFHTCSCLQQFFAMCNPQLPELGKGWLLSIGFGALSPGNCTRLFGGGST